MIQSAILVWVLKHAAMTVELLTPTCNSANVDLISMNMFKGLLYVSTFDEQYSVYQHHHKTPKFLPTVLPFVSVFLSNNDSSTIFSLCISNKSPEICYYYYDVSPWNWINIPLMNCVSLCCHPANHCSWRFWRICKQLSPVISIVFTGCRHRHDAGNGVLLSNLDVINLPNAASCAAP